MKLLLAALTVVLSGCATAPTPTQAAATPMEIGIVKMRYQDCLKYMSTKYDDGVSDAKTIAESLAGTCNIEYESYFEAFTRTDNNVVKQALRHHQAEIQTSVALPIVLQQRAEKRK